MDITSDNSLSLQSLEEGTFEDWRKHSNGQMDRISFLRSFPCFPKNVDICQRSFGGHVDHQGNHLDCPRYKRVGAYFGSDLGACVHDIMYFIRGSDAARKDGWRAVIAMEEMRFEYQQWELIADERLRKQILGVRDEYVKLLQQIKIWLATLDG